MAKRKRRDSLPPRTKTLAEKALDERPAAAWSRDERLQRGQEMLEGFRAWCEAMGLTQGDRDP